jgi:hypothetical protein
MLCNADAGKSEGPGLIPLYPGPSVLRLPLGGDPPLLYACPAERCPAQRAGGVWGRYSKPFGCLTAASAGWRCACVASATEGRCIAHEAARPLAGMCLYVRRAGATRVAAEERHVMRDGNASTACGAPKPDDPPAKIK